MTSVWERERERELEAKAEGIACKTVLRPPFFVNFAGVNIPTEIKFADNLPLPVQAYLREGYGKDKHWVLLRLLSHDSA